MTLGLEYSPDIEYHKVFCSIINLVGYADSNYISNTKSRQLIMGYVYYLNKVTFFWSNKKAKIVIVFLTKAEYIALSNA